MITIHSEDDLHSAIAHVQNKKWDGEEIRFEGFPRFQFTLRGERFNGGVPTRLMPALLGLQRTLDKATADIKGVRRLDAEMLRSTEIVVHVERGSSSIVADLAPMLNTLVDKMTGTDAMITILGLAGIFGGVWVYKSYLNHRGQAHRAQLSVDERLGLSAEETKRAEIMQNLVQLSVDERLGLSAEETKRAETMQNLANQHPILNNAMGRNDETFNGILNCMHDDDQLFVQGAPLVDGKTGKCLAREPREEAFDDRLEEAFDDRLDGVYMIVPVAPIRVHDGLRVTVQSVDTKEELVVHIPAGTLSPDQLGQLQVGEWGKKPLRMKINVRRVESRIVRAALVKGGLAIVDEQAIKNAARSLVENVEAARQGDDKGVLGES